MLIDIITALLIPWLLGIFLLAAGWQKKLTSFCYAERLALAFLAGCWLLVLIMFSQAWLNIPLDFFNISHGATLVILCLAPWAIRFIYLFVPPKFVQPAHLLVYLLLGLIGLRWGLIIFSALNQPMIAPDIINLYALAVKHIYIFKAPFYWGLKPPLPLFIEAWPVLSLGQWNDTLLALFYPFMLLSLLAVFYYSLRRYCQDLASALFTFLLVSLPLLLYHASTAYTDFPQAVIYAVATIYLYQFVREFKLNREKSLDYLATSLFFLGIGIWVKKSGIYYAGINSLVLLGFLFAKRLELARIDWQKILLSFGLFILVAVPWLAYQQLATINYYQSQVVGHIKSTVAAPGSSLAVSVIIIVITMLRNMFLEGNWQLLWLLFLACLLLKPKTAWQLPQLVLALIIFLNLGALLIVFGLSNWSSFLYDDSLINRLMLHFAPIVVYFCAIMIFPVNEKGPHSERSE